MGEAPEAAWAAFDAAMGSDSTHDGFLLSAATPALIALVEERGGACLSWSELSDGTACTESLKKNALLLGNRQEKPMFSEDILVQVRLIFSL